LPKSQYLALSAQPVSKLHCALQPVGPQLCPLAAQSSHATPPVPQWASFGVMTHVAPAQQPVQVLGAQLASTAGCRSIHPLLSGVPLSPEQAATQIRSVPDRRACRTWPPADHGNRASERDERRRLASPRLSLA
jgi:hypothetical protein